MLNTKHFVFYFLFFFFMGMGLLGGSGCVGLVVCGGEMGVVWVCIIGFGRGCDGFGNR